MINWRPKSSFLSWVGVSLIIFVAVQPLWGLPVKGDDTWLHFYRIPVINALWKEGIIYSRWSPNLVLGYGYPLFNFYPPLSAYLLTILYWLMGQNAPVALNAAFALALALSAVHMFLLGRHLFGDAAGVAMSAVYTLSPLLLVQAYGRGSLSNALAVAFFPLAMLLLARVVDGRRWRSVAWAALALAAVFLSHIASAVFFVGPLLLLSTAYALLKDRRRAAHLWLAVALGLALSAFSWLPALAEFSLTRYAAEAGKMDFADFWAQLAVWPGPVIAGLNNAHLPKQVGIIPLFLGLAGAVVSGWRWRNPVDKLALISGVLGIGAAWLTTPTSIWLWQHIGLLQKLQFPWRLLDLAVFFLLIPAGTLFSLRRPSPSRLLAGMMTAAALTILFWQALPYLYPPRTAQLPRQPTLADVQLMQQKYQIWGLTAWGEYTSQYVPAWPASPPFPGAAEGAPLFAKLRRDLLPPDALAAASGNSLRARLQLDLPQAATIVFDSHYFPGWRAAVDGVETAVAPGGDGMLAVPVPAGDHQLTVWFGRTPIRALADTVSLIAVLLLIPLIWRGEAARQQAGAADPAAADTVVDRARLRQLLIALGFLLLVKTIILDRFNTPLVTHPTDEAIPGVTAPVHKDFGEISLIGYQFQKPDQLTLYWSAQETPSKMLDVRLLLADGRGVPVREIINHHPGENVTIGWEAGMITRDQYTLPLAQGIQPIGYQLSIALLDAATGQPLPLQDSPGQSAEAVLLPSGGLLKLPPVKQMAQVMDDYPQLQPVGVVFGDAVELSLQTVEVVDGALLLTLVWQVLEPLPADYTLFLHILNPDGSLALSGDGQPTEGVYPTSFWEPGELIVDQHTIPLDLPPGKYDVQVGLYQLGSGQRLPVSGPQLTFPDRVDLGKLSIEP